MTVEEIFNKLAQHMCEGVMYHDEMQRAYDFLGLWGFSKCHLYHLFGEKKGLKCFSHYYAKHYFKLLQIENPTSPKLIPETWYKYRTQDVDSNTKKSTVKDLMNKWVAWEQITKTLYEEMYQELIAIKEVAAATYLQKYIYDVNEELCHAQKELLKLETLNYELSSIISESDKLEKKYTKKLGW